MKTSFLAAVTLATLATALPMFSATAEDFHGQGTGIEKRGAATVFTKCSQANTVALTFDDGPYMWHEEVAQMLNKAGAKGTFFVNGNNWDCIYSDTIAKQLLQSFQQGHQIGSHTWSHVHMANVSSTVLASELKQIDDALLKILGVKAAFLRPPYGEYNDNVRTAVGNNGQQMVTWDFDSGDSTGSSAAASEKAYDAAFAKHPSSLLPLNHETYNTTVHEVLPYVLNKYGKSGYKFVTVAECLGMKPYLSQVAPGKKDSSWHC